MGQGYEAATPRANVGQPDPRQGTPEQRGAPNLDIVEIQIDTDPSENGRAEENRLGTSSPPPCPRVPAPAMKEYNVK